MQHKNKQTAEAECSVVREHEFTPAHGACALARLLIYATADARELGSEEVAIRIEEAVESLKGIFALNDSDILPGAERISH